MNFLLVGNLIVLVTVVRSYPFPRPTGPDFPPFSPSDSFFGDTESRAHSGASASSSGEGIEGLRRFGIGCSGNPGFSDRPDGHDGFDMSGGGLSREEHGDRGGPPLMRGDGFDVSSMAGAGASAQGGGGGPPFMLGDGFNASVVDADANAGADVNVGSPFLGSGISGALGSATATANAAAGIDAGPKRAQSLPQTKSDTPTIGNGAFSSATSFSSTSAT